MTVGRATFALITLLACKGTVSTTVENQHPPQRHLAGKVVYETTWVADPAGAGDLLHARVLRHNTASPRVVYFDGKNARTEEVNAEYGFRSPCIKLWLAGSDTMLYCKQLPFLRFCIAMPRTPAPIAGPRANVTAGSGERVIAGVPGRLAHVASGPVELEIVHAPDVVVDDPTGAVDRLEGVSGFLLEQRTVAAAPGGYAKRVTVTEASFVAPAATLFTRPEGFRWFDGIDAARAEDRRLGDQQAAAEGAMSAEQRAQYVGRWELVDAPAVQILEIAEAGAGYQLTTLEPGASRSETAAPLGRQLRVDEPPNYRLYRLEPDRQHLVLVGSESEFRYRRAGSAPR